MADSVLIFAVLAIIGIVITALLQVWKGFLRSIGDHIFTKLESWITSKRVQQTTDQQLSDEELRSHVEQLAQSITRDIKNCQNQQPLLDTNVPFESIEAQVDRERVCIEQFVDTRERVNNLYPFETVREEYQARGVWDEEIDELWETPNNLTDLRELVQRLAELRKYLHN